jgi:hypothetical protein
MRRIDEQWTSFYGVRTTVPWLRLQGNRPSFEVLDAIEGNDLIAVGSAVMTGFYTHFEGDLLRGEANRVVGLCATCGQELAGSLEQVAGKCAICQAA